MVISIIKDKLIKTRTYLAEQLERIIGRGILDETMLSELEGILIQADLGVEVSNIVIAEIKKKKPKDKEELFSITRDVLREMLKPNESGNRLMKNTTGPTVILVLGVNGTGKTTTIAKMAYKLKTEGSKVLLAAADTFRAAAVEQLQIWAERLGIDVVKHVYKADPSAVVFDALKAAISRNMDYLIIDTAGRFHNKENLIDELKKIERTLQKHYPGSPHEKILVLDATAGQNSLVQAREFNNAIRLSGIIVTKLDGTAKGGIIVGIQKELNIPVKYIGTGQELNDLECFDPVAYAEAIL